MRTLALSLLACCLLALAPPVAAQVQDAKAIRIAKAAEKASKLEAQEARRAHRLAQYQAWERKMARQAAAQAHGHAGRVGVSPGGHRFQGKALVQHRGKRPSWSADHGVGTVLQRAARAQAAQKVRAPARVAAPKGKAKAARRHR